MCTMDTHNECSAYKNFRDLLKNIKTRYQDLNRKDGRLYQHVKDDSIGEEVVKEFVRGGIVAIMAAWESFVLDLFEEAFGVVIDVCSTENGKKNLRCLQERWPTCRTIIYNEVELQAKTKNRPIYEVVARKVVEGANERSNRGKRHWRRMLDEHRDRILHTKTLLPIFNFSSIDSENVMCIDELFQQLFLPQSQEKEKNKKQDNKQDKEQGKSLSDMLIECGGFKYPIRIPDNSEILVTLESAKMSDHSAVAALCNISRLYYGLRCVLVHGKPRKTLTGVLKYFPDDPDNFPLPARNDRRVKKYFVELFNSVKQDGRNAEVCYQTLYNLGSFLTVAAKYLMKTVAKWITSLCPDRDIWANSLSETGSIAQSSRWSLCTGTCLLRFIIISLIVIVVIAMFIYFVPPLSS